MESNEFKIDTWYKVFFEKQIPIEFKFIEITLDGKILCEKRDGAQFDFNMLEQFLSIKESD